MKASTIKTIFLLFVFTTSRLFAEVTLTPHPDIVAIGAMQEPLPVPALIRASLIASGTPRENIQAYSKKIMDITLKAPAATGNDAIDGERLLKWMHENYLTQYVEKQTRMDTLLDNGRYNCVSSAVLYMILVSSRNIPIHGVAATDHAFCHLPQAGDIGIDVETTTAYGFDPGNNKQALETFSGRTGFAYVPPGNYLSRQDIGEKELIALIYLNRISGLQDVRQWEPTVDMALEAWRLTGTNTYKEYFLTSLKNLGAAADQNGNYEFALDVYIRAVPFIGSEHGLGETAYTLVNNVVVRLQRSGKINNALNILEKEAVRSLVPPAVLEKQLREIRVHILENTIKTASFNDAVIAVDESLADGTIDTDRWIEISLFLWSKEAQRLSKGKNWINGMKLLNTASSGLKNNPQFSNLLETYMRNTAVSYHNKFVAAFRNRDWQEARQIVSEGLTMFPTDTNLLSDSKILKERGN